MSYQIIKYKLNVDGTTPVFVGKNLPQGLWGNYIEGSFAPCDNWFIGVTNGKEALPNGQAELISTKTDLKNYLDTFTTEWHYPAEPPLEPMEDGNPFNQEVEANWLWLKLKELNS